jgi:hypothetical protein
MSNLTAFFIGALIAAGALIYLAPAFLGGLRQSRWVMALCAVAGVTLCILGARIVGLI